MSNILIVDDDVAVTNHLRVFLMQTERFDSAVVNDSRKALETLAAGGFDALLLDMDMPNVSGLDILQAVHDRGLGVAVIILTGVADVEMAVRAMKLGAFDYLTKPVDEDTLLKVLDDAIKHTAIKQSILRLPATLSKEGLAHGEAFEPFPTQDTGLIRVFHEAEQIADGDSCVFVWGERGTYKEMLARAIHHASPRKAGPFVSVDAAAREPDKFAAELFGQAKEWSGARGEAPGLVEQAAGGTLFIDEVDLLSIPVQVRLRRLIQAGEFYRESSTTVLKADVRVIAASHHDLTQEYYKKMFSRDLLYHLMLNSLRIPSLQERPGDIPLLADHFLAREAAAAGKKIAAVAQEVLELLRRYDYPDNVRELRNIIAQAVADETGPVLTLDAIAPHTRDMLSRPRGERAPGFHPRRLDEVKRCHACLTLDHFKGDRAKAAEALGVGPDELDALVGRETAQA